MSGCELALGSCQSGVSGFLRRQNSFLLPADPATCLPSTFQLFGRARVSGENSMNGRAALKGTGVANWELVLHVSDVMGV
jgi:hypothetical protein